MSDKKKDELESVNKTKPIITNILIIIVLFCIYGGFVYFGKLDPNPINWFIHTPTPLCLTNNK
tara:strand:+ start:68 stop:256 length:189 start_codon:yes stop_codon:yes gene_type:complete